MRRDVRRSSSSLTVVITGASGFIGTALCYSLAQRGHTTVAVDRVPPEDHQLRRSYVRADVLELSPEMLRSVRADVLVHLAEPASVGKSFECLHDECRNGLLGTSHVIDVWRDAPAMTLVYVSSAAVYGNRPITRYAESLDCRPLSPYGALKAAAENLVRIAGARSGKRYVIVRPFSVYGPGLRKQVIYDVANRMLTTHADHLEVAGTGKEERDFVYVDDCCDVVAGLVERPPRPSQAVVNVGTGRRVTLQTVLELVRDYTGARAMIRFRGSDNPGNPRRLVADVRRLACLGMGCPTKLEVGLRRTVDAIIAAQASSATGVAI